MEVTGQDGIPWPPGNSDMARRIGAFDWGGTPLGPLDAWPQALRTVVEMVLASPLVSSVVCGRERILIYNDAAARLYGSRHPAALGRPLPETFPEGWRTVAPFYERVFAGETVQVEAQPLDTSGEGGNGLDIFDAYLTPVRDDTGKVAYAHMVGFETSGRLRVEASLRRNEAKYRTLFEAIDEGFCIIEIVQDEAGRAADFRFVEVNDAFLRQTGLVAAAGRLGSEVGGGVDADWLQIYDDVARTGEGRRFEKYHEATKRWYDIYANRVTGDESLQVCVVFNDITERREREERGRFLLRFSDMMRAEPDVDAVANRAIRMLADQMQLDRCYITYYRPEDDEAVFPYQFGNGTVPPLPARVRLSDFREAYAQVLDRTFVVEDDFERRGLSEPERDNSKALGMRAMVASTARRAERRPISSLVAVSSAPRRWSRAEIALVEEAAERTWAAMERARIENALRESEQVLRVALEAVPLWVWDVDVASGKITISGDASKVMGFEITDSDNAAERARRYTVPEDGARHIEALQRTMRGEGDLHTVTRVIHPATGEYIWMEAFATLVRSHDGKPLRVIGVGMNITEEKRVQAELEAAADRQAFLLKLGDAMLAEPNADGVVAVASRMLGDRLKASRVVFAEIDDAKGLAHIREGWTAEGAQVHPAQLRLADFGGPLLDDLRAGRTVRYDDVGSPPYARSDLAALASIGIRAGLSVPLLVAGRFVVNLNVHQHEPRIWTDAEVDLVKEVASRIWSAVEQARAEAALRESAERLLLAVEVGAFSSWDWDLRTGHVTWNDRHYLMQGYAVGEVTPSYEAWLARVHPDDREQCNRLIEEARDTGKPYINEFRMLLPDQSVHWAAARGLFFRDAQGKPYRMIGIMQDITGRKEMELALRQSEERFRLVAENVKDYAVFMLDAEGRVTDWFPGAESVFGWPAAEIRGQSFRVTFTPEDRASGQPDRELQMARLAGVAPNVRWHLRKDGFRRFIHGTTTALQNASGQVVGFVKIGQDTTNQRMAEEALSESETRFRQFGEASSDVIWIRDAATLQMEYVSPAFETVYGTPFEHLFSGDNYVSWTEMIHPEDREHAMSEIERVRHGEKMTFEYRIRRADGGIRWLRDAGFPLRGRDGRVLRIGGIGQDITEEKETRERMSTMVRELNHRARNLVGVVQAIANQTLRSSDSLDDFQSVFIERLGTLARVQNLVAQPEVRPTTLQSLLMAELEALATGELLGRISIDGPVVNLKSAAVQSLALAFHELATNARKYGALLQPGGRLNIRWHVADEGPGEPKLIIGWTESGVANRPADSVRSYGRQLIEEALPVTLGGSTQYEITENGLTCVFILPMSRIAGDGP